MPVKTDNLNLNLNLNLGASVAAGGGGSPRFNTEDFCKLTPSPFPAALPLPTQFYTAEYDPELRAWGFVHEFIVMCNWGGGANTPITVIRDIINAQNNFPVPNLGNTMNVTRPLNPARLADQVLTVLNAALDRADRAMEIMDQASASGALNYWTGLLRIDPAQEKNAYLLMLVGRKIGEYVAMGLKEIYRMRRPSQVYPHVMPLIDPPNHSSFPSGHSLQSHLISGLLKLAVPAGAAQTRRALDHLADRVAENREIAGVHYRMDSRAGALAARECVARLAALPAAPALPAPQPLPAPPTPLPVATTFQELVLNAAMELRDLQ